MINKGEQIMNFKKTLSLATALSLSLGVVTLSQAADKNVSNISTSQQEALLKKQLDSQYKLLKKELDAAELGSADFEHKYGKTNANWALHGSNNYQLLEWSMNQPSYNPKRARRIQDQETLALQKANHENLKDWIKAYEDADRSAEDMLKSLPPVNFTNDEGCKAALCWAGGNGVSECVSSIAKVQKRLARGKGFPTCNGVSILSLINK